MEEVEVLELYELHYSDLITLSTSSSSLSCDESRLERIRRSLLETLAPQGSGLLSITGVPKASLLRRNLLPLARHLALLDPDCRKRLLKEHNLGSDVPLKNPDRSVSSFAMQLKYTEALESAPGRTNQGIELQSISEETHLDVDKVENIEGDKFENLSNSFKELGYCMMEMGLRLAQICDGFIGGNELERSLLESGTAKGRLIHYHSLLDNLLIKEYERTKGSTKRPANSKEDKEKYSRNKQKQLQGLKSTTNNKKTGSCLNYSDLWQQWHYDYGIFTVLTAPMFLSSSCLSENIEKDQFLSSCDQECPYPNGYSYLQIFDPKKNNVVMVKTSPESFIIQVGESADILSKGKLKSTLHSVCRPLNSEDISRETFVVFLQPSWNKTFTISDYDMEHCKSVDHLSSNGNGNSEQDIHKIIPPLWSRLKEGMTFLEFSRETTKQYYGGRGLQSNR
ncbi:2-oxoglutarate (2OG) and Fe(II)-dependent oxygenase superfamily protein [Euphorbia peplus]|nr:2-oxoglutarate (2OG) and Fe(II)-dependent oxygenase superfamily protein [Euphorbia peplus]